MAVSQTLSVVLNKISHCLGSAGSLTTVYVIGGDYNCAVTEAPPFPSLTSGVQNTYMGVNTCVSLTSGTGNSAFGSDCGTNLNSGSSNTLYGAGSGDSLTSGGNNTIIGGGSENSVTTGEYNTIIGRGSGTGHTSGDSYNICLGANVTGVAGEIGVMRLGNVQDGTTVAAFLAGAFGVNLGGGGTLLYINSDGKLGTLNV